MTTKYDKPILDACCGGKMFYFDKHDPRVLFHSERIVRESHTGEVTDYIRLYLERATIAQSCFNLANILKQKVSEILELTPEKPIFGHISGKRANTHWICFMKGL